MRLAPYNAHRAAWILTYGDVSRGVHVLHRCDNPPCVNPAHLFLGTQADNMADKVAKGRLRVHPPRFGPKETAGIRARYVRWSVTQAALAREYGCCQTTIDKVIRRIGPYAHY